MLLRGIFQNVLTSSTNQGVLNLQKYNRSTYKVLEVDLRALVMVALVHHRSMKNPNLLMTVRQQKEIRIYMENPTSKGQQLVVMRCLLVQLILSEYLQAMEIVMELRL